MNKAPMQERPIQKILIQTLLLLFLITTGFAAIADDDDSSPEEAIQACLSKWPGHPFNNQQPTFRTIAAKVSVLGFGEKVKDTTRTEQPELILVKPNVSVLTKNTITLANPNGWYCMYGRVNVLSSSTIKLDCNAHIASASEGTSVLADSEGDNGVTVLGEAIIEKTGCNLNP